MAVSGISEDSQDRVAELLPGVPIREVPDVVAASDLVLLTVPDDALTDLVSGLARLGHWRAGQIVIHTSGAHGLGSLQPAITAGCGAIALHPAMSFTGTGLDLERLVNARVAVTAHEEWLAVGAALVVEWGAEPFFLTEAARPLYHAALSHASNHLVTLVAQAQQVLRHADVEDPSRVLGPLLEATLANALQRGDGALTGPVARGDAGTVAMHRAVLAEESADIPAAYAALARATLDRAVASGRLGPLPAAQVREALEGRERHTDNP